MNTKLQPRRIVLAAANGFLGRGLARWFSAQGDEVIALVRRMNGSSSHPVAENGSSPPSHRVEKAVPGDDQPTKPSNQPPASDVSGELPVAATGAVRQVLWDGETLGQWASELEGATAVINLAGRSVDCRYHAENRRQILESRLRSTLVLGQAIAACAQPPPVWLNSSSATIYRHAEDRPMDEATGEMGHGFSVDVCRAWEAEVMAAATPRTRRVLLRTAMVLGKDGGVFVPFRLLARLGLSGTLAGGRQYMSWLHETDFARAIDWLIAHPEIDGPVNLAAPHPIPNAEWMRLFRERFGPGIGLPAARWMLEIGAFLLRTETELLLKSRRVVPGRLLKAGFRFRFPTVPEALEDLAGRVVTGI